MLVIYIMLEVGLVLHEEKQVRNNIYLIGAE